MKAIEIQMDRRKVVYIQQTERWELIDENWQQQRTADFTNRFTALITKTTFLNKLARFFRLEVIKIFLVIGNKFMTPKCISSSRSLAKTVVATVH